MLKRPGPKTHLKGQHDYPQFLADRSKILTERGAVVDGSFHAPSAHELKGADVLLVDKGDAGYMSAELKKRERPAEGGSAGRQGRPAPSGRRRRMVTGIRN